MIVYRVPWCPSDMPSIAERLGRHLEMPGPLGARASPGLTLFSPHCNFHSSVPLFFRRVYRFLVSFFRDSRTAKRPPLRRAAAGGGDTTSYILYPKGNLREVPTRSINVGNVCAAMYCLFARPGSRGGKKNPRRCFKHGFHEGSP